MDDRAFLGKGWAFPVSVDCATGRIKTASCEEDIEQSVRIILQTRKGERVMQPEFGSNLHSYVFESGGASVVSQMIDEIIESLTLWEQRIERIEVSVDRQDEGGIHFSVGYVVRSTNSPYNMVFPFYWSQD